MIPYCLNIPFCLLEPLYKFLTSALSKIENLKIIISWHLSDMWLSYPIFAFCSEKFIQFIKCIKGNVFLISLHCYFHMQLKEFFL